MRIKLLTMALVPFLSISAQAFAGDDHKVGIFHSMRFETDYGGGEHGPVASWDLDGWIGGDYDKLWLKSEGENADSVTEKAEFWALYSRNVARYWDIQGGIRHDTQPESTSYAVAGIHGVAPYHVETELHLFLSDDGDASARLHSEKDFLLTQRLITQPYLEVNLFAQDVPEQEIGAGFTSGEIGLQTRYEFKREIAPYVDFRYERKLGETSSIAKSNGEDNDNFIASIGMRFTF